MLHNQNGLLDLLAQLFKFKTFASGPTHALRTAPLPVVLTLIFLLTTVGSSLNFCTAQDPGRSTSTATVEAMIDSTAEPASPTPEATATKPPTVQPTAPPTEAPTPTPVATSTGTPTPTPTEEPSQPTPEQLVGHPNLTEALKANNPDLIQEQPRTMTDGTRTITVLRHKDLVARAANPPFELVGMTDAEFVSMIFENLADHHHKVTRAAHGPGAEPYINALNWAEIQANIDDLIQPTDPDDPNRVVPRLPMIKGENPNYPGVRENQWLAGSIPVSMDDIDHLTVIQLPAEALEKNQPFPRERRALIAPDGKPLQVAMINKGSPTFPGYFGLIFNRRSDGSNELAIVSCSVYTDGYFSRPEKQPNYYVHARLGHGYLQIPARILHYSILQSESAYQDELSLGGLTDAATQMQLLLQGDDASQNDLAEIFLKKLLALGGTDKFPITNPLFQLQSTPQ